MIYKERRSVRSEKGQRLFFQCEDDFGTCLQESDFGKKKWKRKESESLREKVGLRYLFFLFFFLFFFYFALFLREFSAPKHAFHLTQKCEIPKSSSH